MGDPVNAFELIERLKKENGKAVQGYSNVSRYIGFKARDKGIPVSGQFELTPLCNFSCRMCYVHLDGDQLKGRSVLPAETWKDLMRQAWEAGMLSANLTGGECLAYPGFEEIFLYLHSLGCEVGVLTNGYLLDEERISFFVKHRPTRIQITLYGCNDDVYERVTGRRAFTTVIGNAKKAIEAGLPVSLNITPNTFLGDDGPETLRTAYRYCRAVTVNSAIFSPREETGRAGQQDDPENEMYLRIYRVMDELNGIPASEINERDLPPAGSAVTGDPGRGFRCGGGRSGFVMNWEGAVMPCNRMEMIRADALKEGFAAAWAKINKAVNEWPRVAECEGCVYREICNNCPANQLRFAHEPGKLPAGLCEQTKYFVCHGVKRMPECET